MVDYYTNHVFQIRVCGRKKVTDEESIGEKRKRCCYRIIAVNRHVNRAVRSYTDISYGTFAVQECDVNTGMDLWQEQRSII